MKRETLDLISLARFIWRGGGSLAFGRLKSELEFVPTSELVVLLHHCITRAKLLAARLPGSSQRALLSRKVDETSEFFTLLVRDVRGEKPPTTYVDYDMVPGNLRDLILQLVMLQCDAIDVCKTARRHERSVKRRLEAIKFDIRAGIQELQLEEAFFTYKVQP